MAADPKIIERIKALLAKTTENGCTEGEALAAMAKARELMDKHQIASADLASGGEGCETAFAFKCDEDPYDIRERIAGRLASYCDCKAWIETHRVGRPVAFFGLESDAVFATWLSDMLNTFCNREATRMFGYAQKGAHSAKARRRDDFDPTDLFGGSNPEHLRASFVQGFVDRINLRLGELIAERQRQRTSDGRSLVVVKSALVEQRFGALGIKLGRAGASSRYQADPRAYGHGAEAGSRAQFSRPVGGSAGPRLIGR